MSAPTTVVVKTAASKRGKRTARTRASQKARRPKSGPRKSNPRRRASSKKTVVPKSIRTSLSDHSEHLTMSKYLQCMVAPDFVLSRVPSSLSPATAIITGRRTIPLKAYPSGSGSSTSPGCMWSVCAQPLFGSYLDASYQFVTVVQGDSKGWEYDGLWDLTQAGDSRSVDGGSETVITEDVYASFQDTSCQTIQNFDQLNSTTTGFELITGFNYGMSTGFEESTFNGTQYFTFDGWNSLNVNTPGLYLIVVTSTIEVVSVPPVDLAWSSTGSINIFTMPGVDPAVIGTNQDDEDAFVFTQLVFAAGPGSLILTATGFAPNCDFLIIPVDTSVFYQIYKDDPAALSEILGLVSSLPATGIVKKYRPVSMRAVLRYTSTAYYNGDIAAGLFSGDVVTTNYFGNAADGIGNLQYFKNLSAANTSVGKAYVGKLNQGCTVTWLPEDVVTATELQNPNSLDLSYPAIIISGTLNGPTDALFTFGELVVDYVYEVTTDSTLLTSEIPEGCLSDIETTIGFLRQQGIYHTNPWHEKVLGFAKKVFDGVRKYGPTVLKTAQMIESFAAAAAL